MGAADATLGFCFGIGSDIRFPFGVGGVGDVLSDEGGDFENTDKDKNDKVVGGDIIIVNEDTPRGFNFLISEDVDFFFRIVLSLGIPQIFFDHGSILLDGMGKDKWVVLKKELLV